jgi:cyclophilin family peptidyl-prolyl cis-trans isomerase
MHRRTTFPAFALVPLVALVLGTASCKKSEGTTQAPPAPSVKAPAALNHALMQTDKGTIEIELMPNVAPRTVENFRLLAQRDYYNGIIFHRIIKGFMIQGGDPQGTGRGGQSAWGGEFEDEIEKTSPLYRGGYKRGQVAMANSGPNTNTSQFFIIHKDYPLPPNYTIFGQVTKGIEVVDAIAELPMQMGPDGNKSSPVTPPKILKITLAP